MGPEIKLPAEGTGGTVRGVNGKTMEVVPEEEREVEEGVFQSARYLGRTEGARLVPLLALGLGESDGDCCGGLGLGTSLEDWW